MNRKPQREDKKREKRQRENQDHLKQISYNATQSLCCGRFCTGDVINKKVKFIWNSFHADAHAHLLRHEITHLHSRTQFTSEFVCRSLPLTFPFHHYCIFALELIFMPFGKGTKSCVGSVTRHNFHSTNFSYVFISLQCKPTMHFCFHLHLLLCIVDFA